MSATHDVDRLLATWFAADATETAPAGLVETIAQVTATTRRRPGWLLVAHRMPALPQLPIAIRLVALAAILLAVAIASIVVVGSRPRVPPPFGPARPGIFALSVLGDIVTMTTDGVPLRTWTSDDAWDSNPAFSRDGTQLAFWSWPLDSNLSELVVMKPDGSGRQTVAQAEFLYYPNAWPAAFAWSPDGRSIAYWVSDVNESQVFIASTEGRGVTPVGDPALRGAFPAWSPDGSMIAIAAGANDNDRGLYLMRPDGEDVRRISSAEGYVDAFAATWSPDGHHLAFTGGNGKSALWMVDVDGSNEHQVDEAGFLGSPAWAPDGRWLAWLHVDEGLSRPAEYRLADTDGTNVRVLPLPGAPQFDLYWDRWAPAVGWSADGRYVIGTLTSDGSSVDRLIEFDPDSGDSQIIAASGIGAWSQQRLAP